MKPAAVIFDLDGTLLDTLASLAQAFNGALQEMGYPPHPVDAYRQIIGDGARVAAIRALPDTAHQDSTVDECAQKFRAHYESIWQDATIYTGMSELLDALRPDIPLAVLSNKDEAFTKQCVAHFFPGVFQLAVGFNETIRHKPDPSGASHIVQTLKVAPAQTWMVGDTATDMNTAAACNMTGIGVLWGFRDQPELQQSGAAMMFATPGDLLQYYRSIAS
jgi:phosphoglycolate phosphatase